jgi:streptogramin lyase
MVTAFDSERHSSVSVFSQPNGRFAIKDATRGTDRVRARLIGLLDNVIDLDDQGKAEQLAFEMEAADSEERKMQMRGVDRLNLLKFDNEKDALNFKMMCTYCHQVGTEGFRTPEEPVDWQVMLTRMDGFGGLYPHTQKTLVDRIVAVYGVGAEEKWPDFKAPPAPSGKTLEATIYEWSMGKEDLCMIHDLEPGKDGLMYVVDMANDCVSTLNPETAERMTYAIPGGKEPGTDDTAIKGPHSIEVADNGDMWLTLALSGQMAKFDPKSKEFTQVSGAVKPRPRGRYPHSLRLDQKDMVWYTDAGTNSVFSLHPKTHDVKEYKLLHANQAVGGGRGESRGITPYGIDIAPDGKVWYSKLNGQRVGRIDPQAEDGSPEQIKEWQPPVHGPRRLHVAPDGIVWVPGWASGDFARFDPKSEAWKVYELPAGPNSLPYALNIHPKTGDIWVCGTGWDTMICFVPSTEEMTVYPMPSRVTYTREVEFDKDGNVWVCNSNYPVRHTEDHRGSLIKIVLPSGEVAGNLR